MSNGKVYHDTCISASLGPKPSPAASPPVVTNHPTNVVPGIRVDPRSGKVTQVGQAPAAAPAPAPAPVVAPPAEQQPKAKFCTNCGKQVFAKFCTNCGASTSNK